MLSTLHSFHTCCTERLLCLISSDNISARAGETTDIYSFVYIYIYVAWLNASIARLTVYHVNGTAEKVTVCVCVCIRVSQPDDDDMPIVQPVTLLYNNSDATVAKIRCRVLECARVLII